MTLCTIYTPGFISVVAVSPSLNFIITANAHKMYTIFVVSGCAFSSLFDLVARGIV